MTRAESILEELNRYDEDDDYIAKHPPIHHLHIGQYKFSIENGKYDHKTHKVHGKVDLNDTMHSMMKNQEVHVGNHLYKYKSTGHNYDHKTWHEFKYPDYFKE